MAQQKKPQKKQLKTGTDRLVEKALDWADVGRRGSIYPEFGFEDFGYDGTLTEEEVESLEKKLTEVAVFKAIKKNKKFQKSVDRLVSELTSGLLYSVKDAKRSFEQDKKYQEQLKKQEAERLARQQQAEEKVKKDNAQRAIFLEGLTAKQKKAIKKFYNLDVGTYGKLPDRAARRY